MNHTLDVLVAAAIIALVAWIFHHTDFEEP